MLILSVFFALISFFMVIRCDQYDLVGLVPQMFPPVGYPKFNGSIISTALKAGQDYVNRFVLHSSITGDSIFIDPISIGINGASAMEDKPLCLQTYNSLNASVMGIVGPSFSSSYGMLNDILSIPLVCKAQKTMWTENDYFFRIVGSNVFFLRALLDAAYGLGAKEIILLYDSGNGFSSDSFSEVEPECIKMGMNCVPITFEFNADVGLFETSANQAFAEIQNSGIKDVLFIPGTAMAYSDYTQIFTFANSAGVLDTYMWFVTNILYNRMALDSMESIVQEYVMRGIIFVTTADGNFPAINFYRDELLKVHPGIDVHHYKTYYDSVLAFGEAIRQMRQVDNKPITRDGLLEYFYKVDIVGSSGRIKFIRNMNGERASTIFLKNIRDDKVINAGRWSVSNIFEWRVKSPNDVYYPGNSVARVTEFQEIPKIGNKWISFPFFGVAPKNAYGYCLVEYQESFIVFGGGNKEEARLNSMFKFDIKQEKWSELVPRDGMLPPAMKYHQCNVIGDSFYAFGGLFSEERIGGEMYVFHLNAFSWEKIAIRNFPAPRFGHQMIIYNKTKMIVHGGIGEISMLDDVWIFDHETEEFYAAEINTFANPQPRYHHTLVSNSNGDVILFGGITNFDFHPLRNRVVLQSSNDIWKLSLSRTTSWAGREYFGSWNELFPSNVISKRNYNAKIVMHDKLYIFYGYSYELETTKMDIYSLDISDLGAPLSWETMTVTNENEEYPFAARNELFVTSYDDNVIFFSGIIEPYSPSERVVRDMWVIDIVEKEYKQVYDEFYSPDPVVKYSSILLNDKIFVFGGSSYDGTCSYDVKELNLRNFQWRKLEIASFYKPIARERSCFAKVGKTMIVFGGVNEEGTVFNDFFQFIPISQSFKEIVYTSATTIPGRYDCTMSIFNDRYVYLVGGFGDKFEQEFNEEYYVFDIERKYWKPRKFANPADGPNGLISCSSEIVADKMYFHGCKDLRNISPFIFELDLNTSRWRQVFKFTSKYISTESSFVHVGDLNFLIFGGVTSHLFVTNYLLQLDLERQVLNEIVSESNIYPAPQKLSECVHFKNRLVCLFGIMGKRFILSNESSTNEDAALENFGIPVENDFKSCQGAWAFYFDDPREFNFSCGVGSVLSASGICEVCPPGFYYDQICVMCPAGFYSNTSGGESIVDCIPCHFGSYSPSKGSSFCIPCNTTIEFCPIGSKFPFDKEYEKSFRSVKQPGLFSRPVQTVSLITMGIYVGSVVIWSIVVIGVALCWKWNCIKMEHLLFWSFWFKSEHDDDTYDRNDPQPEMKKRSVTGGFCTCLAAMIIFLYFSMEMLFFVIGFDDDETVSMIPAIMGNENDTYIVDLKVFVRLHNYDSGCSMSVGDDSNVCVDNIEIHSRNLEYDDVKKSCANESSKGDRRCCITFELSGVYLNNKTVGALTDITFVILTENSYATKFDYEISVSTGYPTPYDFDSSSNQNSNIEGSLLGNVEKVFRGYLPLNQISVELVKTKYSRAMALRSPVEKFGYHLNWLSHLEGNEVDESDFPSENGIGIIFKLVESDEILEIVRSNEETVFTFIPNILGSSFGLLGAIGIFFFVFDWCYKTIGWKNDITEKELITKKRMKKNLFKLTRGMKRIGSFKNLGAGLKKQVMGGSNMGSDATESLELVQMDALISYNQVVIGQLDEEKCKYIFESDQLVCELKRQKRMFFPYKEVLFNGEIIDETPEFVSYYIKAGRKDKKRKLSVDIEFEHSFAPKLMDCVQRVRLEKRKKLKEYLKSEEDQKKKRDSTKKKSPRTDSVKKKSIKTDSVKKESQDSEKKVSGKEESEKSEGSPKKEEDE